VFNFSDETVGAEPKSFLSVVGFWTIGAEGDNKFLVVEYTDPERAMAGSESPHKWGDGRRLSEWQALSEAHPASTGDGEDRHVVEGRQCRLF
jgi:hypothetical protein